VVVAGLITPEAVVLDFDTAGIASRVLARVVDVFVVATLASTASAVLVPTALVDQGAAQAVAILIGFLAIFGYPAACEAWWGATPGKMLFGLKVITTDGGPIAFRAAAIRSALQVVDFFVVPIGVVAVVSVLAGRLDQRLGDRLAATLVVRRASLTMRARAVAFPPLPGYERYAASLDVSALSAERYEVLRSFLTRVDELAPAARRHLAARLTAPIAAIVGQGPPASMHPEVFLVSVAAAYQQRHGGPATWMWGPQPGAWRG
jgi:uncharacterized RDD family membrane protein YckC